MAVVDVKDLAGKKIGTMELADDVFAAKVNSHLLHEAVRHYLAGQRAGTHKTKDKSEVSGSGKKLWRQKGTGRARVGSIRSPLWRHGGTVHGPVPRSYEYSLPKKMVLGALRSALSAKLAEQKLTVVDEWKLETHKTKAFRDSLDKLDGDTRTILLVENGGNVNLERASRNLDGVTLVPATALDPYHLLRHEHLMLSREAATKLSRALSAVKSDAGAPPAREERQAPPAAETAKVEAAPKAAGKKAAPAKAAKKPAAKTAKKEKPKAKPKGKKG
ncbi:MAG TPA: 50S ribosomal protein L4 [Candidatus Acidoferrales bacterium]|nr:50S ribosomal protein L4 [Candidatus Acidoferrales bacterium]